MAYPNYGGFAPVIPPPKGSGPPDSQLASASGVRGSGLEASLYLHIPFCAGLCDYCDFYSIAVPAEDPRLDRFIQVLAADVEAQLRSFAVRQVPTLYAGGGTPSILGARLTARLLGSLRMLLPHWPSECTLEVNPESGDKDFLLACLDGGVNRISLGIQTFHEPSRTLVRRAGNRSLLLKRLALVSHLFPGAFSADLIAGLPGQNQAVLLGDIERLLSFQPAHIALYALTPEAGTPLASRRERLSQEETDRLWLAGAAALEAAGYEQYEVSNFALPGKRSCHNLRYWRMENWLGAGPGASGTLIDDEAGTGRRYTAPPDAAAYLRQGPPALRASIIEELDTLTLIKETCLMGFRYIEGPERRLCQKRFRRDLERLIPRTLARWRSRSLAAADKTALTRKGLLFLNPFLIEAFEELDETFGMP